MRGLEFLLICAVFLFGSWCQAGPQAHWVSDKQIQLYYPSFRILSLPRFELVSDSNLVAKDLKVQSRRGDLWLLSTDSFKSEIDALIKRPLWVRALDGNREIFRTSLRLTGLLDQKFADPRRPTGVIWSGSTPTLRVWAPTAVKVELVKFTNSKIENEVLAMTEEPQGFWSIKGRPEWNGQFYRYRVSAFSPGTGNVETHDVTDPASISLAIEGSASQIVNPDDDELKPSGWDRLKKPELDRLTDAVVYEMHLRDMTVADSGLSPLEKGTFAGLANPRSKAYQHIKELAQAGITHVHLLPITDFAGVPENVKSRLPFDLFPGAPDSSAPQEQVGNVRTRDAYNWGYNPVHWMTPEGSYTQNPNGSGRILELRNLVQSLNQAGARVVLDVVFNHTYASGLEDFSVLDLIVPYYYHRYDDRGELMKSSCCADVATENVMTEKLIVDSLVFLAKTYKIDGFRFDLLNLHPRAQVARIRDALADLNVRESGVDGSKILLYAEAWPFGSLEDLQPGSSFTQLRSSGIGVGVFNDRMRDALRGGTTDSREKSDQGFATGLYWDFNEEPANTNTPINLDDQKGKLLFLADVVKIGMAGNLKDFVIRDHTNAQVRGGDFQFRGVPVAYASEPGETISYVSAHDGFSLWDAVQAKLPFSTRSRTPNLASVEERVRTHRLMLGTVALSQGIPFFEGGSELLRSKSGDVDSYDSGDWFNHIDWTLESNNWGVGLPPAWRNQGDWPFWQPRLAMKSLSVGREEILATKEYFKSLLRLRKSSPLLRLSSSYEIRQSLVFPMDETTGGDLPGLIVLLIEDKLDLDPKRKALAIFVNAASQPQNFRNSVLLNRNWKFPDVFGVKQDSALGKAGWSSAEGRVQIPARTLMVLEEKQ